MKTFLVFHGALGLLYLFVPECRQCVQTKQGCGEGAWSGS